MACPGQRRVWPRGPDTKLSVVGTGHRLFSKHSARQLRPKPRPARPQGSGARGPQLGERLGHRQNHLRAARASGRLAASSPRTRNADGKPVEAGGCSECPDQSRRPTRNPAAPAPSLPPGEHGTRFGGWGAASPSHQRGDPVGTSLPASLRASPSPGGDVCCTGNRPASRGTRRRGHVLRPAQELGRADTCPGRVHASGLLPRPSAGPPATRWSFRAAPLRSRGTGLARLPCWGRASRGEEMLVTGTTHRRCFLSPLRYDQRDSALENSAVNRRSYHRSASHGLLFQDD